MRKMEERYQPIMVMGCAIEKERRRAMFRSKAKLAMRAKPRETPLLASNLRLCQSPEEAISRMHYGHCVVAFSHFNCC